MNQAQRRHSVLFHEGQCIQIGGQNGIEYATEVARCTIDGCMNALIRMEGVEKTAEYAFALSDRVVGGVKEPTNFGAVVEEESLEDAMRVQTESLQPEPKKRWRLPAPGEFWIAYLVGLAVGFVIGWLR